MGSIANERNQAAQLSGRATTRALANENLYFTQKLATGLDDADKLHQAAIDYYEGRSSMMATSSADRQEVSRRLEELHYLSNHLAFLRLARGSALRREISNVDRW